MGLFSEKKPYTAISSDCEALIARGPHNDPSKLLNLIELIRGSQPSSTGGHEAGRFLRKKLKYGSPGEQSRSLTLVEILVDNGIKTGPLVAESGLGDQMMQLAAQHTAHSKTNPSKAARVTRQCRALLHDWSSRPDRHIAQLYSRAGLVDRSEMSRRHRHRAHNPDDDLDDEVFGEDGKMTPPRHRPLSHHRGESSDFDEPQGLRSPRSPRSPAPRSPRSPAPRSSRSPTARSPAPRSRSPSPVNLRGASLETTIASAHNVATRLTNALIATPHGSRETASYYRQGKQLRHRVVKLVHDPSPDVQAYIGQLLAANEELVAALQAHDAVVSGEALQDRSDHEPLDLKALDVQPVRPPPSPRRLSISSGSSGDEHTPDSVRTPVTTKSPPEEFDPFADDFEQAERPKHTPIW